jgi:phage tail sheath gpL-like
MGYAALRIAAARGVPLYLQAVSEPAGTAATATVTIGGTWSSAGELVFRFAGQQVSVAVASGDTTTQVATAVAAAFNKYSALPATAGSAAAVATLTCRNIGASQRDWILYYRPDLSTVPAGLTVTLAGSATVNTTGVRFGASGSGTGTEDVTTCLTFLTSKRYARIACGQSDATNAALWETQINTNAAPLSLLLEHMVFGHNGTTSAAISLAQTTLNAFRGQVVYHRNSEAHPAEIAAVNAALRAATEGTNPVPDYDNVELEGVPPQAFPADLLSDAEQNTLLNAGVTPVHTVNGTSRIVRAITTYCLNGAAQDERCLDIGDAVMPDYVTLDLRAVYESSFRRANPLVRPDPAPEEKEPPTGIGYPKLWNSQVAARVESIYYANGWVSSLPTGVWAPKATFNTTGKYIMCELPLDVSRVQHRLDQVVRQVSNS